MPIGTATAIAISLGTAAAQTTANIYGAKKAADTNRTALDYQREEAAAARKLEAERMAMYDRQYQQAALNDQTRWRDYVGAHSPHWALGANVLPSLAQMAGVDPSGLPAMNIPSTSAAVPPAAMVASAPQAFQPVRATAPRKAGFNGVMQAASNPLSLQDLASVAMQVEALSGRPMARPQTSVRG